MPTYIALLRGINVGKAKRVPMAELRALLGELGFTRVSTLLNSGNAVFRASKGTAPQLAAAIAAALLTRLNVDVPVIVKTSKELAAVIAGNPLATQAADHSSVLVAFTQETQTLAALGAIAALVVPPEQFALGQHAAYLHCVNGILESQAGAALLGKLGQSATSRNWATVLKLQALASQPALTPPAAAPDPCPETPSSA